jgi:hypothetical protein
MEVKNGWKADWQDVAILVDKVESTVIIRW